MKGRLKSGEGSSAVMDREILPEDDRSPSKTECGADVSTSLLRGSPQLLRRLRHKMTCCRDGGCKARAMYNVLQWTWGLPQTILGTGLYLMHGRDRHFDYRGARATAWKKRSGISLGRFIFVPELSDKDNGAHGDNKNIYIDEGSGTAVSSFLLKHEYGHTVQSLVLGPFYLLLVGLPSILWSRVPACARHREKTGRSYYSVIFESTANRLGGNSQAPGGHRLQDQNRFRANDT